MTIAGPGAILAVALALASPSGAARGPRIPARHVRFIGRPSIFSGERGVSDYDWGLV
jgi:hypothetical protein